MRVMLAFFFFKEVQSDILSGQAGDGVPFAAGTIDCLPAGRAPHPLLNNHTHTLNTGIQVLLCIRLIHRQEA